MAGEKKLAGAKKDAGLRVGITVGSLKAILAKSRLAILRRFA